MYKILVLAGFCSVSSAHAQSIETGGGLNRNKFYTWKQDEGHSATEYHAGNGFSFFLSVEDTVLRDVFVKFSLVLDKYYGALSTTAGGQAGSSETYADVSKTTLGLAFYPFNYKFLKSAFINVGLSYSLLLNQEMEGYHSWWYLGTSSSGYDSLDSISDKYKNISVFSAIARIAYKIPVTDSWQIVPQYTMTFGFSKEFINLEADTKAFRHTFALGISRSL